MKTTPLLLIPALLLTACAAPRHDYFGTVVRCKGAFTDPSGFRRMALKTTMSDAQNLEIVPLAKNGPYPPGMRVFWVYREKDRERLQRIYPDALIGVLQGQNFSARRLEDCH